MRHSPATCTVHYCLYLSRIVQRLLNLHIDFCESRTSSVWFGTNSVDGAGNNWLAISFRASIWCRFQLAPRVHDCVFTKVKCPKHHLVAVWKNVWRSAWVSPLVGSCGEEKKRWFDSKDQQRKTKSHVLLWTLHTPLFQLGEPYLPFATYLRAKLLFLHLHIYGW